MRSRLSSERHRWISPTFANAAQRRSIVPSTPKKIALAWRISEWLAFIRNGWIDCRPTGAVPAPGSSTVPLTDHQNWLLLFTAGHPNLIASELANCSEATSEQMDADLAALERLCFIFVRRTAEQCDRVEIAPIGEGYLRAKASAADAAAYNKHSPEVGLSIGLVRKMVVLPNLRLIK